MRLRKLCRNSLWLRNKCASTFVNNDKKVCIVCFADIKLFLKQSTDNEIKKTYLLINQNQCTDNGTTILRF
jgi:hypothetical protein